MCITILKAPNDSKQQTMCWVYTSILSPPWDIWSDVSEHCAEWHGRCMHLYVIHHLRYAGCIKAHQYMDIKHCNASHTPRWPIFLNSAMCKLTLCNTCLASNSNPVTGFPTLTPSSLPHSLIKYSKSASSFPLSPPLRHLFVNCARRALSELKASSRSNNSKLGGGSSRKEGGNTCKNSKKLMRKRVLEQWTSQMRKTIYINSAHITVFI